MPLPRMLAVLAPMLFATATCAGAQGFSFSQPDQGDRVEAESKAARISDYLSTPCRQQLSTLR